MPERTIVTLKDKAELDIVLVIVKEEKLAGQLEVGMTLTITACKVITIDCDSGLRYTDFSQIEISNEPKEDKPHKKCKPQVSNKNQTFLFSKSPLWNGISLLQFLKVF